MLLRHNIRHYKVYYNLQGDFCGKLEVLIFLNWVKLKKKKNKFVFITEVMWREKCIWFSAQSGPFFFQIVLPSNTFFRATK